MSSRVAPAVLVNVCVHFSPPWQIMRAREELLFADPPSYYTDDKILTFTIDIPPEMLKTPETERGALPEHHFALLELQLRHVQAALMVGHALGRSVVLPRFSCTCQNEGIVPHENCRGPGHPTKLPYKCPSDHVFVPYEIYNLKVKPPGFADHPCMPPEFMCEPPHHPSRVSSLTHENRP